ncbi:hypothetical protein L1277_001043 [Okibacterium sp. HSC-33S16]|uniref:DUF6049 family protein n=1 Tax=Okibacterium sp. HSC-33S16 TaxID=2910965 RepID=UPI0020A0900E|nr:DUF6049 family protein [Okibacterium sp. HSC-33S16]MCP2030952.1 hypothetical protein [Okibacterium sp. HSC-33S16]
MLAGDFSCSGATLMTQNRLPLTLRALLATAVGLLSLGTVPAASALNTSGVATAAITTAAEPVEDVSVSIRQSASFLGAGATMAITVTIENGTDAMVPDGTLSLESNDRPLTSRTALSEWLDLSSTSKTEHTVAAVPIPALEPGGSYTATPIEVSPESLALPATRGTYPLDAVFSSAETVVEARDTIVYSPDPAATPLGVAVVMPLTAPATTAGLLTADALAFYTSPTGVLTKQLDGVIDRPVALGIDPMLIASIRALGNQAPASAVGWLDRLSRATNETFPLQYADADPSVQSQAGIPALLSPTSLLYGLNSENFAGDVPEDDGTTDGDAPPEGTETPSPTPTPDERPLPSLAELTEWNYTTSGVVWPADNTVMATDLPVFAASGATSTIVSSSNVVSSESYTPGAAATIGDAAVIVSDSAASLALRNAATAISTDAQQDALADLAAQLMVVGSERGAPQRNLVLTLDRGWPPTSARLSEALSALATLPGVVTTSLNLASTSAPSAVTVTDMAQDAARTSAATRLSAREAEIASFATVLDDPTLLTGRERAEVLALLSISWRDNLTEWTDAVTAHDEQTTATLASVSITATTQINMVSNQTSLPFSVRNDFNLPVTVVLQASTSSLKLSVDSAVTQTIPANSRETVRVPVQARLGNGDVSVRVQLYSPQNALVGGSVHVPVSVRADWEGIGATLIGVLIGGLFLGGLIRTIRKRRPKADPSPAESVND